MSIEYKFSKCVVVHPSHSIDHMLLDLELVGEIVKRLIQALVHAWRPTDPNFTNFARIWRQSLLNKLFVPHLASETVPALADTNCQLEVILTKLTVHFL